ncbi:MAG TPA: BTAD domain-containing putative transcriptional regulator [Anaerolineae bacterium]
MVVNLPVYLTSFIGRTQELADIRALLPTTRLFTLTGPGGGGKTRLAARLAADLAGGFAGSAWWVELVELKDARLVPQAVTQVLGLREVPGQPLLATIAGFLGEHHALLILDNCEHLVMTCAQVAETLLQTCPHLQIISTSREPLGLAAETVWRVPPLSLPEPDQPLSRAAEAEPELLHFDAIRLFVERAKAALPSFALTSQNEAATLRVCRRLDGIPLALELAATRVALLTVQQIADRLDDRFALLTTGSGTDLPRHRTLQAMIDWSHELLSSPEQLLFRRLAVFADGFTLEAAEQVCAGAEASQHSDDHSTPGESGLEPAQILDLLGQLVNKSLVVVDQSGVAARYRLLETLRQYALEHLQASGEEDDLRTRHQRYFAQLTAAAQPHLGFFLSDQETGAWLQRLQPEYGNLRAALEWGVSDHVRRREASLQLAGSLHWYWVIHGFFTEPRRILADLLRECEIALEAARASAFVTAGYLACWQGDFSPARPTLEEAQRLYRRLEDSHGVALAMHGLGWTAFGSGQYDEAQERFQSSLSIARELDDRWLTSFAVHFLGIVKAFQGDYGPAREHFEECIALSLELGGTAAALAFSHFHLGRIDRIQEDYAAAQGHFRESLQLFQAIGDPRGVAYALVGYAALAAARHEMRRSARLCGAVANLREALGPLLEAGLLAEHDSDVAAVQAELGRSVFSEAWTQGRTMGLEEVIAYALGQADVFLEPQAARPEPATAGLRLFALGPTRVYRDERLLAPADWTFAKPKELLYYLLAESPRTKEQIGVVIWPDASPDQLSSSLKSTLFYLRRALGRKEWILYERGRYAFNRSFDYWYDVEVFESCLVRARKLQAAAPAEAVGLFEQAKQLYQGDYLEDLAADEWCQPQREALRRQYLAGLLSLGELLFAENLYERAAETYHQVIALDELLEEAHRGLIRCQSRLGERGLALRQYETLVELLADELGVEPAPETSALYRKLQRGQEL